MISAEAKRRLAIRNGEIDPTSNDNFIINYEPTIEIIEKNGRTKIEAENRGQAILDDAFIPEIEHAGED
jgi:hypothetical protein